MEQKPSLWRDARRWLPGVIISLVAVLILFLFASQNWNGLVQAWAAFQWPTLVALVLLTILSLVIRALLWRTLLEEHATLTQSFFIINIGYLLNNFFPLRAGEIGRAVFMGSSAKLNPFHVLSTIVIERAFDLVMAAVLVLGTLPLALGLDPSVRFFATIILVVVASMLGVLFLMARYRAQVNQIAVRLGGRWPLFQRLVIPQVDALLEGLQALVSFRRFLAVLGLVLVGWLTWIVIYYIGILAIAPNAPFWWAMFADSLLALGVAIPSAPAALGVYEGTMVIALTTLGVVTEKALAYALLMHSIQFALTAVFGFWGLAREGKSLGNLWAETRRGLAKTSNAGANSGSVE